MPEGLMKDIAGRNWLSDHLLGSSKEENSEV